MNAGHTHFLTDAHDDDPVSHRQLRIRDDAISRLDAEQDGLREAIAKYDEHVNKLVADAVDDAVQRIEASQLTSEERAWVRMAVIAAGKRAEWRDAVISKTLAGLVWAMLLGLGALLLDWLRARGLRV